MPRPSRRKQADIKANIHGGGVICVLYSMRNGQSNGHRVGHPTRGLTGANLHKHAEPQWWNLNHAACNEELFRHKVLQFEFEVTQDFCSDTCRVLFGKARHLAIANGQPQLPIFVFIYRTEEYYEVTKDGEVDGPYPWS